MSKMMVSKAADPSDGGSARSCVFSEMLYAPYGDTSIGCCWDMFCHSAKLYPDNNCLGYRPINTDGTAAPYSWYKYTEVKKYILIIANAILGLGLKKGDKIGIYAKNCVTWALIEVATSAIGVILVPLYDTLGPNAVEYVCNHAEVKVVFVQDDKVESFEAARPKCPTVQTVVAFESGDIMTPKSKSLAPVKAGTVKTMEDFMATGSEDESTMTPGTSDDLFVIMYTSGTTGDPKGVMISNRAMLSSVAASHAFFKQYGCELSENDSVLSYLPLAHIFEQQSEMLFISIGGSVGFYQGDVKKLLEDMEELKPTIFIGVPRVFSRFEQRIREGAESASFIKKFLFNRALNAQTERVSKNAPRIGFWDGLVFKGVRNKLLPNVRIVVTGSAPMSAKTNDFLKVVLNTAVVQGYGLTESLGGAVCSAPYNSTSGHCGGPMPCVEVKLDDVTDMGYTVKDQPYPRGEVCLRGPCIAEGYYKNEKATSEAWDADGWFHTGDVGQWLADGQLQIIDRKKNLFKLAHGEYVSPEALEQEYQKCKLVGQIFVYGNSFESVLVAAVVPDIVNAKEWAAKHHVGSDLAEIAANKDFKAEVLAELKEMKVASKFKGYEEIKDVHFETEVNELGQGFTVENGTMTPTFKLKRPQLLARYKAPIDAMYATLSGTKA